MKEAQEKIAKKGQLRFGYVDWDVELEHTKQAWRELASYAIKEARKGYRKLPLGEPPLIEVDPGCSITANMEAQREADIKWTKGV